MFSYIIYFIYLSICLVLSAKIESRTTLPPELKDVLSNTNGTKVKQILNSTRRILDGVESRDRNYMVYLKLPVSNPKYKDYRRWLCGGVIIHEEYILTSAACIEDVKHFYVVSGTYSHDEKDDRYSNTCIKNGAKKAIWKCIPRNYIFDGHENDNIRWMSNDIAVVKVEDEFDFYRRVKGCDFIPRPICFNNQTSKLEEPGQRAIVAGWGSTATYNDPDGSNHNLLESPVEIMSKSKCKRKWGKRYHNIIDNYMICTKDNIAELSEVCQEKYVDCTEVAYDDDDDEESGRRVMVPTNLVVHSAHNDSRRSHASSGGFCENDHGGPLIADSGGSPVVIGIISACLVKERTNKCYGPFLYTSVYKNRNLISCAVYKDIAKDCNKLFRSSITHTEEDISWKDHPDGPAKNEINKSRRLEDKKFKSDESINSSNVNSTVPTQEHVVNISTSTVNDTNREMNPK